MKAFRIQIFIVLTLLIISQTGLTSIAANIYKDYISETDLSVDNDNLAPVTDFSFTRKQKVDIVVVLGEGANAVSAVQSKLNSVVEPILAGKSIEAVYNVTSSAGGLDKILPELTWGESSERYYIAVSNGLFSELSDKFKLTDIISYLGNDQISFIGMGNAGNQAIIEKLISNNSGKGCYISNANLDTAFTRLANYIAGNINIDLFFNVGLGPVNADMVKAKYESIVKPKLVANDISANVNINTGTYNTVKGAKIAACTFFANQAGYDYSNSYTKALILKPDGTLWNMASKTRITGENSAGYLSNIVDMACSLYDYFAVDAAGYVYKWGVNGGAPANPTKVAGGDTGSKYLSNIIKIAAGDFGRYALRSDGTVWYWGSGYFSKNDKTYSWSIAAPKQARLENGSILGNIVQIAAGGESALALDSSGNLYILSGSMCPKFSTSVSSPRRSPHIHTNSSLIDTQVSKISAATAEIWNSGRDNIGNLVYLKRDGSVWMLTYKFWGEDDYDYCPGGDEPHRLYSNSSSPKMVDVFAGNKYVHGLGADGRVYKLYSWPRDDWGELPRHGNYGSTGDIYTMASIGEFQFYYIKNNGDVWFDEAYNQQSFTGFNASISGAYPYDGVLSGAPFRDENDQYFVELSDAVLPELSDSAAISGILGILGNSNIRTVGMGSSTNAAQLQYINTLNGGKGAFYDISNIDAAMNSLADYIISNSMRPPRLINDYFLVNDEIEAPAVFYSDIESDPYNSMWVYEHEPFNFLSNSGAAIPYDNSAGYFSLDRKILSEPVASFIDTDNYGGQVGKVGGYKVKLQVRDKPKGENTDFLDYNRNSNTVTKYLNIHRKPVAYCDVKVTDLGVDYNIMLADPNYSYDPDHTSRADKGIVKRIWGIATITPEGKVSWKYSKSGDMTKSYTVPKGNNYLLSLEVQDMDGPFGFGEWSDPVMVGIPGRPVAQFTVSPDPLPVTRTAVVTDTSYATVPGYTIVQRKWNVEKIGDTGFRYIDKNICKTDYSDSGVGKYKITLEVMDSGGAWSLPCVRTLTVLDTAPPVIDAVPASRPWSNSNAAASLTAHDDGGSGLKRIDYVWTLNPSDISAYSSKNAVGSDFNIQTSQSRNGKWYLCARAMDNSDNYSNSGSFSVFGTYNIDKIPPTVSSSFDSGTYQDSVTTSINAADTGGSGIRSIQYKWTNSTAKPASGWISAYIAYPEDNSESIASTIDLEGTWYLHMQVTDYAGNAAYKCSGPVIIQNLSISDITIEGYWNHWRGQVDMLGKRLTNEPHRFLSLECVRINVGTAGNPDRVTIRFSPELEAMEYTDPDGHTYSYSEYFGHEINFPEDSTFAVSGDHIYWEYNLPLAPSSKGWEDNRLRPQYSMTVTVYKDGRSVTRTIDDIDITGNIYDLTYIQPRD